MYSFYMTMKAYHVGLVTLSVTIFCLRGTLMLVGNQSYLNHWYRRLTPLIDSVLLILGVTMAVILGKAVLTLPWFLEKMVLLVCYIGFGIPCDRIG